MSLSGKVALVTGSTSGIGLGIARSLAGAGGSVVLNGFGDKELIETLVAELGSKYKVKASYSAADMRSPPRSRRWSRRRRASWTAWTSW